MAPSTRQIKEAAQALHDGELVAFPTETVYGLGGHARDLRAVARIFEVKARPHFDPLIVHVADANQLSSVATDLTDMAMTLAEHFWPGPLTLVLPKRDDIPDLVTAGHTSVAVRVPAHPVAQALLREAAIPVAAPSANRFGGVSPTRADHVRGQLDVQWVLDGGPCEVGVESTIISLLEAQPTLLRSGGLPLEAITARLGPVRLPNTTELVTLSPGRQTRHYAPRTPMRMSASPEPRTEASGLLTLVPIDKPEAWKTIEVLSETGDLNEAAAALFAAMRRLDAADLSEIVVTPVPERGLGRAIMDRLRRAAELSDDES